MMKLISIILLILMIVCCISVSRTKGLLTAVVIYMSFSMILAVIWLMLEAADLAITEAAVGCGIDSILLFVTLKKIHSIHEEAENNDEPSE